MAVDRYNRTILLSMGTQYGTAEATNAIRQAIANNQLNIQTVVIRGVERLDTIAGKLLGDAKYWWILAATSNIGWGLQVPPGTIIKVPVLKEVLSLIG